MHTDKYVHNAHKPIQAKLALYNNIIVFSPHQKKEAWWQLHENATSCIEQVREATQIAAVRPPITHYENYPS